MTSPTRPHARRGTGGVSRRLNRMRASLYVAVIGLATCLLAGAGDAALAAHQIRFAQAQQLAEVPETELDGIGALAVMAQDPQVPTDIRIACMEAIIRRHAAAGRMPALADTVDTTLRLFPELPSDRAFELRLIAGGRLSHYALDLPVDDVRRDPMLARAQAFLVATTQIQREKRGAPAVVAEAMYWLFDSLDRQGKHEEAYVIGKRITWDYPASKWAKIVRAKLVTDTYESVADGLLR